MSRIDRALEEARSRLRRLSAREVPDALARGAVLVDIRPHAQREIYFNLSRPAHYHFTRCTVPDPLQPSSPGKALREWAGGRTRFRFA